MNHKTLLWLAALLSLAASCQAVFAAAGYPPEPSAYLGGSIGNFSYISGDQEKVSPKIGVFRVGVALNPYIAIEGRIGTGLSTEFTELLGGYDLKIDSLYGGYLKGNIPLSPVASLYGLAGYTGLKFRRHFAFSDQTVTDDSPSFGGGLDLNLRSNLRLNVEWARLIKIDRANDNYHADSLSIGLVWLL